MAKKSYYDPVKAHEYYMRTRKLKGRKKGSRVTAAKSGSSTLQAVKGKSPTKKLTPSKQKRKVERLQRKIKTLEGSLTRTMIALTEKRRNEAKKKRESSDGKSTAKEKRESKEYRDKNKAKVEKQEKKRQKSSGGRKSSSSSSSKKAVADMSVDELQTRVRKIRGAISDAKKQLSKASSALKHSDSTELELYLDSPISRKESAQMSQTTADLASTTPDFGGYATRNDVRCSDGRTILADAFKNNDGMIVPLVWEHGHKDPTNVLGHVKLENRTDGVYAHAFFNKSAKGQHAKEMVRHGDIKKLSIFANELKERLKDSAQNLKDVVEGNIREVSLVLAGANEGAFIDHVNIVHSDGSFEVDTSEAIMVMGSDIELTHADALAEGEETIQDVLDTLNDDQAEVVNWILHQALNQDEVLIHAEGDEDDEDDDGDDETVQDVLDTLNEKQKDAVNYLVSQALAEADKDDEDIEEDDEDDKVEHSDASDESEDDEDNEAGDDEVQHTDTNSQEDNSMTHNVFDQAKNGISHGSRPQVTLSHSDVQSIVEDAKENGSLKKAVERFVSHTGVQVGGKLQHGIENIDYLFPDAKTLENTPAFIQRRMEWVDKVLSSVRKSPFSRIKTITADITPDEARARGYIKGNMKNEEFFALSKRETTPQTVYKKQKLDRDDVIDIVDLDVVSWLKAEMKVMLDEEIAGAILVGDGRSVGDDDKIRETNIRPIASDAELYATTVNVNLDDAGSSVEELVDAAIESRKYYKGTGQPTFYTTESVIAAFLTVKDNFGRRLYSNLQEVAAVLRVSEVVPVEVMERVEDLVGIMVNLADYTLGADKGGQATMFDDFDIDYNKLLYLIETRLSGALTQPKSALVFRKVAGTSVLATPVKPDFDGETVTVPTVTGVTYHNAEDDSLLETGDPVELDSGQSIHVVAKPASGYYFANNAEDEWLFTNNS